MMLIFPFREVMDIEDDIYDGRDYLPYFYHVLLQNKNSFPYVLLVDGKIVRIDLFL